jgi:hypothetical protein
MGALAFVELPHFKVLQQDLHWVVAGWKFY